MNLEPETLQRLAGGAIMLVGAVASVQIAGAALWNLARDREASPLFRAACFLSLAVVGLVAAVLLLAASIVLPLEFTAGLLLSLGAFVLAVWLVGVLALVLEGRRLAKLDRDTLAARRSAVSP